MDKFDIITQLEGRYIQTADGQWHQVINGYHSTKYGRIVNLVHQEIGILEKYLENSLEELGILELIDYE